MFWPDSGSQIPLACGEEEVFLSLPHQDAWWPPVSFSLWYSASLGAETICLRLGLEPMWQDSNPVLTQGLLRSQTRFQDLMKLRFFVSSQKHSVTDNVIGEKWIYPEKKHTPETVQTHLILTGLCCVLGLYHSFRSALLPSFLFQHRLWFLGPCLTTITVLCVPALRCWGKEGGRGREKRKWALFPVSVSAGIC